MDNIEQGNTVVNRVSETDATPEVQPNAQYDPVIARAAQLLEAHPGISRSEALRRALNEIDGVETPPSASVDKPHVLIRDEVKWPQIAAAFLQMSRFAESVHGGFGGDITSDIESTHKCFLGLEMARLGVFFLTEEFNEEDKDSLEWYRKSEKALAPLIIELPKTQDERVADAYWQAMERLNAAGVGFGALLEYHCEKDGEA